MLPIHQIYIDQSFPMPTYQYSKFTKKNFLCIFTVKVKWMRAVFKFTHTLFLDILYYSHIVLLLKRSIMARQWHFKSVLFYSWKKRSWNFQELLKSLFEINKNPSSSFCKSVFVRLSLCAGEGFIVKRIIINIRNMKSQDFS